MGAPQLEAVAVLSKIEIVQEEVSGEATLAKQEKEIAQTRAVIRKFKDAALVGNRWTSASVTFENAKHYDVDNGPNGALFDMYAEVKPLNQDPVRVYAAKASKLTAQHVAEFLHNNPKALFKQMHRIFKIQ